MYDVIVSYNECFEEKQIRIRCYEEMDVDQASLDGVIREGFSEEVPFEQIPQGGKGENPVSI